MPLPAGSVATFRFGDMSAPVQVPASAGEAVATHLYGSRGTFVVDITVRQGDVLWGRRRLNFISTRAGVPSDIPTPDPPPPPPDPEPEPEPEPPDE